jgi:hypothetical protein
MCSTWTWQCFALDLCLGFFVGTGWWLANRLWTSVLSK